MMRSMRFFFALAAVGLVAMAPPASADSFATGPPSAGYKADSAIHTYCFGPGFNTDLQTHANYAMQTSIDLDTDMSDSFLSTCNSSVDVEWLDANLSGTIRGQYVCVSLSSGICYSSDVTLDPAELDKGSNDFEDRRKTACHEAGHSTGLIHGGTIDCMLSGEVPSTALQYRRYSTHHKDHINAAY